MSEPRDSAADVLDGLFARARSGDQEAWNQLFDACNDKVLRVIRKKLKSQAAMRSLYDSSDFMGDVWKSLAEKPEHFNFPNLDALLAFLATAAQRKVIDEHRRLHTRKNDIGRQRPIAAWAGADEGIPDLASHDPTPSQFAQANETGERLLQGQTGLDRRVLELKQEGYSNDEVAKQTGWSLRKVQCFLKGLSDSWIARGQERRP